MSHVVVLGSSGFVGRAVMESLGNRQITALAVRAPRGLQSPRDPRAEAELAEKLAGASGVVNAAGVPDATGSSAEMWSANAYLPVVALRAARRAGVERFVHVSSAAVQGRRPVLDATWRYDASTPYARSKAQGELALREAGCGGFTIYRPAGVHGEDRPVTRSIARLARSGLAVVPQTPHPTPQSLIGNVADAIAFLTLHPKEVPPVVHHPSENLTTHSVLHALGGRRPRTLPDVLTDRVLHSALSAVNRWPRHGGLERRLATLWMGQQQSVSWLEEAGWRPPQDPWPAWQSLGHRLATSATRKDVQ